MLAEQLSTLNEGQLQAVTAPDGPILVVAGPGSGKTRVLTLRIAYLIAEGKAKPWEILSLTFTNKSAREMKERITKIVGNNANAVWAGTFHSIFSRILRIEADKIGFPSAFTIYDTDDSKSVIKGIIKAFHMNPNVYNVGTCRNRISSAKSNLISPKMYVNDQHLMAQDGMANMPSFHKIYAEYQKRCKRAGAMDFDDLLFQTYVLLRNNKEVLEKYQQKFKYVLVDEFQDTNFLQFSIITLLTKNKPGDSNLFVVGDDAQSIYAFRGATIQNILDFQTDFPNSKTVKLEQNYRSTEHIVAAANEVISNNRKQIKKKLHTDNLGGHKIRVFKALSDVEEGKRIAETIIEQKNRDHVPNKEIAILYRTNAQSRVFEEQLRRKNIAYKVFGGLSFYQRKEVKDLIAYLRLAVNSKDDEALKRVINQPKRAIGPTTVAKIAEVAMVNDMSLWDAIEHTELPAKASANIKGFKEIINSISQKAAVKDAYDAAYFAFKASKLFDYYKADTSIEGMNRMENLNSLLDGIKEFVENDELEDGVDSEDKSLVGYLQNIALITDFDKEDEDTKDYVSLMSVHAAKGLEYDSIFVVGLEEKLFPSFMSMDTPEGLDEERRLFYVAITRARKLLTLSFSVTRYQYGQMRYNSASRFLDEISFDNLEASHLIGGDDGSTGPTKSTVTGNFQIKKVNRYVEPAIDPALFKPNHPTEIKQGQRVMHMRFGEGDVINIEGSVQNLVATIGFDSSGEKKRLALKFAKLMIME